MNSSKIRDINSVMERLRVISYVEDDIESDTNFINLKKGNYKLNNGHTIIRESVVKKSGCNDAVSIFAITDSGEVLIVIQPRTTLPTANKMNVEIPAGYIELGESPVDAARRELEEETGYIASDYIVLDSYYPSLGCSGEAIYTVVATGCKLVSYQNLDSDEFLEYMLVSLDDFKYLLDNNYIMDGTARLAYYNYLSYINKKI